MGKLVIAVLAGFIFSQNSYGQTGLRPDRVVQFKGMKRAYTFLTSPRYRIRKTQQQMMAEAQQGRQMFAQVFSHPQGIARSRDLLRYATPVKDQGSRGTCVAFASVAQMELMLNRPQRALVPDLSEQYIYWASKALAGINPNADGSVPYDMLRVMERYGTPIERAWGYEPLPWFSDPRHPECQDLGPFGVLPVQCVTNGDAPATARAMGRIKATSVREIGTSPEFLVGALSRDIPVQIGVAVFAGSWGLPEEGMAKGPHFYQGRVLMPQPNDLQVGGHAVLVVGYDLDRKEYIFKNSWGVDEWASQPTVSYTRPDGLAVPMRGYGRIPFDYVRQFGVAAIAMPEYREGEFN
ncbi:MAG: C1 family peptidase [Oligoflexia bacterium]|nr:C1 family peptidase [Oligoflexia bacterium]